MRILGFDLGDGESAVTLLDGDSTVEPRVIPLQGRASMLSAVGVRDGRVAVGEEASVLSGAQAVKVRFKSRYLTDPAAAGDVRAFAQGVLCLRTCQCNNQQRDSEGTQDEGEVYHAGAECPYRPSVGFRRGNAEGRFMLALEHKVPQQHQEWHDQQGQV